MNYKLTQLKSKELIPGFHGKLIHTLNMSLAFWEVDKDSIVPEHSHMNEQVMQVLEGKFEFTVNGNSAIYVPGDLVVIEPGAIHSERALTTCKLMDIFSPTREEYK